MTRTSNCPGVQQWHQLLLGQLAEGEAETLELHLAECSLCLQTVRAIVPEGDTLVEAVRQHSTSVTPLPETVRRLIPSLKGLCEARTEDGTPAQPVDAELFDFLAPAQEPDELGRLGPYRVLKVLGSGGMGVVFQADDPGLKRIVALKAMKPALAASDTARKRFLREARATAALDHDHIVHIYQVGEDRGIPFLAMQFLKGRTLDDRLHHEQKLPIAEVLRIGREVSEGLAAAHTSGLVHRDIKPSNIWLEGERGRVKILDFGLARAESDDARLTQTGAVAGTPAYMAPEQARGEKIDARCDLFSLGCVLYRMCTGQQPFKGHDAIAALFSLAQDQPASPRQLNPATPPALSDLVMCLLSKDPAGRPPTASAVIEALTMIEREAAAVRTPSTVSLLPSPAPSWGGSRRRLLAGVVALALLAGGLVWGATVVLRTKHGTLTVETSETDVRVLVDGEEKIVLDSKKAGKIELIPGAHRLTVKRGEEELFTDTFTLKSGGDVLILARWQPRAGGKPPDPSPPPASGSLDRLDPEQIPPEERLPWQPKELVAVLGTHRQQHAGPISVRRFAYSRDGRWIACGGAHSFISLFEAPTLRRRATLGDPKLGICLCIAFSPDSKTLAAGFQRALKLWDVSGNDLKERPGPAVENVLTLAFSADGKTLAVENPGTDIRLLDVAGEGRKEQLLPRPGTGVACLAFADAPPSLLVSLGAQDQTIRLWDLGGAAPKERKAIKVSSKASERYFGVALSRDGKTLALADHAATLRLWDLSGEEPKERPVQGKPLLSGGALSVAFAPDGRALAVACANGLALWDLSAEPRLKSWLTNGSFCGVAFSPDGQSLVTAGAADGAVRIWDVSGPEPRQRAPLPRHRDEITSLRYEPAGQTLISACMDGSVAYWDLGPSQPRQREVVPLISDGRRLDVLLFPGSQALAHADGWLWDLTERKVKKLRRAPWPSPFVLTPDGQTLVGKGEANAVQIVDVQESKPKRPPLPNKEPVATLAVSADGRFVACSQGAAVRLWNLSGPTGGVLELHPKVEAVQGLAFSPDSRTLVVSGINRNLEVWNLSDATPRWEHTVPGSYYWRTLTFSPDGKALVGCNAQEGVYVWDTTTWKLRWQWLLPWAVSQAAFLGDSRHLAVGNANGTIYIVRVPG